MSGARAPPLPVIATPMNQFLDRKEPVYETKGNLPHWTQYSKITFITFRLADSLPKHAIDFILTEYESLRHRLEKDANPANLARLKAIRHNQLEKYLDKGYGSCLLRNNIFRDIVVDALHYDNGLSYILHSYVIMPNHIHILIEPIGSATIQNITQTIKSVSSHNINKITLQKGSIWQKDYFDRIIRNEDHYMRVLEYIRNNPKHCSPTEYTLY